MSTKPNQTKPNQTKLTKPIDLLEQLLNEAISLEEFLALVSDRRIKLVLAELHNEYAKGWKYKIYGKRFRVTPGHFAHLFRDQVGAGLREYLSEIRLHHAQKLLATTELTMCEIADQVGFSNEVNFRRAFKAKYDDLPSRYRDDIT